MNNDEGVGEFQITKRTNNNQKLQEHASVNWLMVSILSPSRGEHKKNI